MKIGVIDSGVGGFEFSRVLKDNNQCADIITILDKSYFPYGKKTKHELTNRVNYLIDNFLNECHIIILACNTLSIMVDRSSLNTNAKVYDMISITKDYLLNNPFSNTLLLGTTNTVKNNPFLCDSLDCSELISDIQNNKYKNSLEEVIFNIDPKYDCIILGCTHLIKVKDSFKYLLKSHIISQDEIFKLDGSLIFIEK